MFMARFELVVTRNGDKWTFTTENDGFGAAEIIGILDMKKDDILKQINEFTDFKRTAIDKDGNKIDISEKEENSNDTERKITD